MILAICHVSDLCRRSIDFLLLNPLNCSGRFYRGGTEVQGEEAALPQSACQCGPEFKIYVSCAVP